MKIILTPEESEEYFYNALCNGLDYFQGYGFDLDYDADQYYKAREKLKSPCFEDVLMQLLRDGGQLIFKDVENEGDMTRIVTLKDIHERVQNAPIKTLTEMADQEDDAITADIILQTVLFNEILLG